MSTVREKKIEFLSMISGIAETYGKKLSEAGLQIYYESLKNYDFGEVSRALSRLVRRSKFMPTIADIVEIVDSVVDMEMKAELAYSRFCEARRSIGAYQTVIFDDPIIHRIVDQHGGWPEVCSMTKEDEQYKAFKKSFITEYKAFARDKDYWKYPKKLVGITEIKNSNNGFSEHIPKPVVVGDPEKAMEWIKKVSALEEKHKKLAKERVVEIEAVRAIAGRIRA